MRWKRFFQRRGGDLPAEWARYRARRLTPAGELRIMVWIGLILGLLAFQALRWWPEPGAGSKREVAALSQGAPAPAPDPYAASRRSRENLERQEGAPAPASSDRQGGGERAFPAAVRVIDGDTFVYGGMRIRIADIDTPEVRGQCASERALAGRATARMRALLSAGPFELHRTGTSDEDIYGRKLRIVTRGGRSLGDQLVAEGLARTWTGRRESWCA